MRIRLFYFIGLFFVLIGCKNISRKPVFEKLMSNELSEAIKDDTSFSGFYTMLREEVDQMDDIGSSQGWQQDDLRISTAVMKFLKWNIPIR